MHKKKDPSSPRWLLLPIAGTLLFIGLYIIATSLYPGGSQIDTSSLGFSWINNYWCNLLDEKAINGQHNSAQPVALIGMLVLCITLAYFWYCFPLAVGLGKISKIIIQVSGLLSVTITLFLFTRFHDLVTNLASLFGLIAIIGIFFGLYKIRWNGLLVFGFFNLLLVLLNNYLYYTKGFYIYLPVIQKISFASFLLWICCVSFKLYQEKNTYQ